MLALGRMGRLRSHEMTQRVIEIHKEPCEFGFPDRDGTRIVQIVHCIAEFNDDQDVTDWVQSALIHPKCYQVIIDGGDEK